jgi:hypothetical protein
VKSQVKKKHKWNACTKQVANVNNVEAKKSKNVIVEFVQSAKA